MAKEFDITEMAYDQAALSNLNKAIEIAISDKYYAILDKFKKEKRRVELAAWDLKKKCFPLIEAYQNENECKTLDDLPPELRVMRDEWKRLEFWEDRFSFEKEIGLVGIFGGEPCDLRYNHAEWSTENYNREYPDRHEWDSTY